MRLEVQIPATSATGITVAFLYDNDGYSEVGEFMKNLELHHPKDYSKTLALFTFAAQNWPIRNREKSKLIEAPIGELKSHQIRILWFVNNEKPNTLVCVSAERKKGDFLSDGTIKRAKDRMREWNSRQTQLNAKEQKP